MTIGIPRGLATVGIMVAVLFMGPATMVVPAQGPVQGASAATQRIALPATAVNSVAAPRVCC